MKNEITKDQLYEIIKILQQKKTDLRIYPDHILLTDLLRMYNQAEKILIKQHLNKLFKEGKVEVGETINDKWIKIKI